MKVFQEVMIHSCVEVAVREKDKAEFSELLPSLTDTSVRITDDISLLNWIHLFEIQFFNKVRNGRRWRKPTAQFEEKKLVLQIWRRRRYQVIRVHHRTKAISYITKSGVVRDKKFDKTDTE